MPITLNGHTYDVADFTGTNGRGYTAIDPQTALPRFPNGIFTDLLAHLASAGVGGGTQNVVYSASMTPNAALGNHWRITATNGVAFTINAPTNPVAGVRVTLTIRNTSGGALGAATFNAAFKTAGYAAPATGFSASAEFIYDGANWVQVTLWTSVIPN